MMCSETTKTILEQILADFESLTPAERRLSNSLLDNYPVSALGSITLLAEKANVSTPTVARMITKLGFKGFPQFQQALRVELDAKISNPIEKHDNWAKNAPDTHLLNRFTEKITHNIRRTLDHTDPDEFNQVVEHLAQPSNHIYLAGGRITCSLAEYFFTHLQMIRSDVTHLHSVTNAWPHYILDMKQGDVLVIFDIRRYENDLLRLAELALERELVIVLFTDQWSSPISKLSRYKFNCQIEVPSAWDSSIVILLILESLVAALQDANWPATKTRMKELEDLFNQTKLFKQFS